MSDHATPITERVSQWDALVFERDEAHRVIEQACKAIEYHRVRAETAEAALAEIVAWDCPQGSGGDGFAYVRQIARNALASAGRFSSLGSAGGPV